MFSLFPILNRFCKYIPHSVKSLVVPYLNIDQASALLFTGCVSTSSVDKKYPYDINKRHIAQYNEDENYFRPDYSWSHRLDANTANLNSVASSGLLSCKENDLWFISMNEREEEAKVRYRYFISLAKSQLDEMEDNATYIPRRDSKEFKDLIEIDTTMARQGLIGCSERISEEQFAKLRTK